MMRTLLGLACLLATPLAASDEATPWVNPKPLRGVFSFGITAGGDKLAGVQYTNGQSDSITAGGGVLLRGGLDYHPIRAFSVQATIGMHNHDTRSADNGSMKFNRTVFEGMAYGHPVEHIRLGLGIRHVSSPTLSGSGVLGGDRIAFDDAQGTVFEVEWMTRNLTSARFAFSLRYVSETFKTQGLRVDGSHGGMALSIYF